MGAGDRRFEGGYLSRYEFEQAMLRVDGRLNSQDDELDKISKAMEKVPRKEDLLHLKEHVDTQLVNLEASRIERENAANNRILKWLSIIGVIIALLTLILKFVKIG